MKTIRYYILIILSISILFACGGDGINKGDELSENEYLGNIPAAIAKYEATVEAIKQEGMKALEKYSKMDKPDMSEIEALDKRLKKKTADAESTFEEAINKARKSLAGKAILYEVEATQYDVLSLNIKQIDSKGSISCEYTIKAKEQIKIEKGLNSGFFIYYYLVDVNGQTIAKAASVAKSSILKKTESDIGDEFMGELEINTRRNEGIDKFAKIVFVNKADFDNN